MVNSETSYFALGTQPANPRLDPYFESEVLNADPVKLVTLLYRGALEAVAAAQEALRAGNILERSKQIQKAWDIVNELRGSLDHEKGGAISRQLADLYAFIGQRLLDGNTTQASKPLSEASAVLTILAEAWQEIPVAAQPERDEYVPLTVAC